MNMLALFGNTMLFNVFSGFSYSGLPSSGEGEVRRKLQFEKVIHCTSTRPSKYVHTI